MTSKAAKTDAGLPKYLVNINAHPHLDCCTKHNPQKDVPMQQKVFFLPFYYASLMFTLYHSFFVWHYFVFGNAPLSLLLEDI